MAHSGPVYLPPIGSTNKYVKLYVDWTAATENANIISGLSGEALATSMGKIAKWKTDFKTLVFTDLSISNGTAETGKAITALSYNTETGVITATKGTFSLSTHTHSLTLDGGFQGGPVNLGSSPVTLNGYLRNYTNFYGSNGDATKPWYKVAEYTTVDATASRTITFLVTNNWYSGTSVTTTGRTGILQVSIFSNSNRQYLKCTIKWLVTGETIDPTRYVLTWTNQTNSCLFQLWFKQSYQNESTSFIVLHEGARSAVSKYWTLSANDSDATNGYAAIPSTVTGSAESVLPTLNVDGTTGLYFNSNQRLYTNATSTFNWKLPDATGTIALTNGTNSAVSQSDTVYVTADNISDGSYFSVPFFLQTTPSTGYKSLVANGAFKGYAKDGIANVEGTSYLILGNATKLSSASNKTGILRLYSAGDRYINIRPLEGEDTITSNRTIYLPNENGTVSLIPNGKYSFFYDNNSDFASYSWHKFAEITVTEASVDNTITFLVCKTYGAITKETGLLTAHIRTSETKVFSSCHFAWHWANQNINPSDFVLVYTNTAATSCKVELWCKQTARYDGWIFRVLKEHSRLGSADAWTLYKISGHGSASYTVGTGTYTSIKIPLASQVAITDGSTFIKSRDTANVYANPDAGTTSSLFYTAAFVKTNTGGWSIGTLPANDKLYFLWTTDENYNNNNNSYTSWTIDSDGLFNGTAAYANAGKHVLTDPNSEVYYGLTIHATAGTEDTKFFRTNNGLRALTRIGTTSQRGYGFVVLGNATASGTDGNKYGGVRIYTSGTKYVQISGTNDNYLSFSSSTVTAGDGIIPVTTATYDLGASTNLWRKVCCSTGVFLRDKTNTVYGGVCDNGNNLWIGATETAATHHVGGTFISSGYDNSTSKGNPTIKISVPNTANTNATSYDVYHTGLGVGKDGFISFPNDGQYTASAADITGALVITCPFGMTNIMMSFTVDIFNYIDNECVSYRISGYNYSTGPKWVNCSASSFGDGTKANLTVRFGYNGTKAQIQIGETNTAWKWPQVRIRDILLGHQSATDRTFMSNRTGWTITFVTTNISNITKTITGTQIYSLSGHTHSNYLGASKASTSYYGMTDPNGTDTNWIRTTTQGIIPYQSGNAGSGHQQLGTSTWYFSAAYIDTVYGSLSGNASTATTLKTARTIALGNNFDGNVSFDGSSNVTISADFYRCAANGNNKANYPWHRFGYIENKSVSNTDTDAVFLIVSRYNGGNFGILKASFRTNSATATPPAACLGSVRWLVRSGFAEDDACIAWWGVSGEAVYADLFLKCGTWPRTVIYQMSGNRTWTLVYSNEVTDTTTTDKKTSVEVYSTIETAATEIHNKAYTTISYSVQYGNVSTSKKLIDGTGTALSVGSTTQPIYFSDGVPTTTTYALNKTVPSDAVFTDTNVTQSASTTTNYRPLVLGVKNSTTVSELADTVTNQVYTTTKIYAQPSSGTIYATAFNENGTSLANKYIPLAGSTAISGSLETNSVSAGFIVPGSNGRKMSLMSGNLWYTVGTTNWASGVVYQYSGTTLAQIGAHGTGSSSSGTCDYFFMGKAYDNVSMRLENDDTGKMTLRGTLPQLKFQQTTSSATYDNSNAGIKAYPAPPASGTAASGMNMTIKSGGNMIIGSGEYPENFYNLANKTNAYPNYWLDNGEQMFIGSDNYVIIHTKADTIANKKTFVFGDNFNLAVGANITFKTNTEVSPVTHSLTTAATTTSRTWTLPDATGTIALTTDIPNTVYVTANTPTSSTMFSIPFFEESDPTTGQKSLKANNGLRGYSYNGGVNVEGYGYLVLGNATKLSSANNKIGVLRLYSAGDKYINIRTLSGEDTITSNRTIYLPNEGGTVSLIPNGKYSFFYDSNSDFASYSWHKFAEITVTEAYADMSITFLVSKTWTTVTRDTGLLTAHIRTNGTKVFSSCHFDWHWANSGIDPSNFVFVYTNTANTSCKVELWYKQTSQHDGWIFRVLKEHSRTGPSDNWTIYKISGHGSASYTTGTGTYTSQFSPLYDHQYTAVGTDPGIWFNQTTTDTEYSGGTYIKAFPGSTAGTNLVIRSGGNVFIGGGESPSNLYERVITTDTNPYGTSSFKGNEVLFLTADSSIYFVTGANGLSNTTYTEGTHLQTVVLNNNKQFYPRVDDSGSIGIGSNYWNEGYIKNIYGTNLGSSDQHFTTAYIDTMNGKATNIGGTLTNSTSEVTESVIFVNSIATGSHVPRLNDGIQYIYKQGTASVTGYAYLKLGNATSGGTAGNKYGCLRIYDTGTKYKNLRCAGAMTNSGQDIYLPDKSAGCTLATTDDIPAAGSWTTLAGSSWTGKSNISQADSTMYYINFRDGLVEICGKVKISADPGVASVRITTIAAAYRPSNIMRFGSVYTSGNVIMTGASISITTAGVIDLVGTSTSTFSKGSTYYFYLRFVK